MTNSMSAAASAVQSKTDAAHFGNVAKIWSDAVSLFTDYGDRLFGQLTSETLWLQLAAIALSLMLAYFSCRILLVATGSFFGDLSDHFKMGKYEALIQKLVLPLIASGFIWLIIAAFASRGLPIEFIRMVGALLVAYLMISVLVQPKSSRAWRVSVCVAALIVAVLIALRLFSTLLSFLDSLMLPFGDDLSILSVAKALTIAIALIWGASFLSRIVEAKMKASEHLTPSVRGLFSQLVRILMIGVAIFFALTMVGIDLTAFAVFTGALGVGIGFGLQAIFSNFVAGIIIILEKTLKVGDFVDLESGITGEVREINVRSTLITTNDNIDMLIPNSEFINKRVINWTLREAKRRVHIPFGVAYGTDKELVKKAALEAAKSVDFTVTGIKNRNPEVWLVGFGDSSLNFELIVWLTDEATKKPSKVNATYCWAIETALAKYNIVIPFPQRDLHLIPPQTDAPQ